MIEPGMSECGGDGGLGLPRFKPGEPGMLEYVARESDGIEHRHLDAPPLLPTTEFIDEGGEIGMGLQSAHRAHGDALPAVNAPVLVEPDILGCGYDDIGALLHNPEGIHPEDRAAYRIAPAADDALVPVVMNQGPGIHGCVRGDDGVPDIDVPVRGHPVKAFDIIEDLLLPHRAAPDVEVNIHHLVHRFGMEGVEEGIPPEILRIGDPVHLFPGHLKLVLGSELVHTSGAGTGTDGDHQFRVPPDLAETFLIDGALDGTLDEGYVIVVAVLLHHFPEGDHIHEAGELDDVLFQICDLELTPLATGEVEKGDPWFHRQTLEGAGYEYRILTFLFVTMNNTSF